MTVRAACAPSVSGLANRQCWSQAWIDINSLSALDAKEDRHGFEESAAYVEGVAPCFELLLRPSSPIKA